MASQISHTDQSIRASCDRCRAKKLGCTIAVAETSQTGVQQCVRCVRAKVDCVFSRRAQAKRRGSSDIGRTIGEFNSSMPTRMSEVGNLQPQMELSPSSFESSSESLSGFSMDWPLWTSPWSENLFGKHGEQDSASLLLGANDHGKHLAASEQDLQLANMLGVSSFSPSAENACKLAELPQPSPDPSVYQASSVQSNNTPSTTEDSGGLPTEHDDIPDIVQLSGLVAEIHEALATLNGESHRPNPNNTLDLDPYPIGSVLKLTRRFMAVLRNFWATRLGSRNNDKPRDISHVSVSSTLPLASPINCTGHSYPAPNEQPILSEGSLNNNTNSVSLPVTATDVADVADVPTMLLVLTCYTSLMKLYMMIFSHIHKNLRQLTDTTYPHRCTPTIDPGGKEEEDILELEGIFPSTSETCGKMYIAVQMILDEFQAVDNTIVPPVLPGSTQQPYNYHDDRQGKGEQKSEAELKSASVWFTHQLGMVRTALNQDAKRASGRESEDIYNGLLQQGHGLKASLRRRMNF